jgi:hypothetical protein
MCASLGLGMQGESAQIVIFNQTIALVEQNLVTRPARMRHGRLWRMNPLSLAVRDHRSSHYQKTFDRRATTKVCMYTQRRSFRARIPTSKRLR